MKRLLMTLVLLALAATAMAGGNEGSRIVGVRGDAPRGDATILLMKGSDTTGIVLRGDASGNMYVADESRTATPLANVSLITNNAFTVSARSDSMTTAIAVSGYRACYLVLSGYLDSLGSAARFAVQVRGHSSSAVDTSSTYKWNPWRRVTPATFAAGAVDSIGDFVEGDNLTCNADEFLWVVADKPALPRGVMIPIFNPDAGNEFRPPYISVRLRMLSYAGAAGLSRVKVRVGLVAIPY